MVAGCTTSRSSEEEHWDFGSYLDENPETREVLVQRLQSDPEYEAWLRLFGEGVLSALDVSSS